MTLFHGYAFCTSPMLPEDVASGFTCGVHDLDDFFTRHAWPNTALGLGRTWIWRGEGTSAAPLICGFYTLSMAQESSPAARAAIGGRLPRYPLPVALLGRLAVHRMLQGQGGGARLLRDALWRVLRAQDDIAAVGVKVDARDDGAQLFYARFGFVELSAAGWPRPMFLTLAQLHGLLGITAP